MERPKGEKGEVVIRTIFGEIAADSRNFSKPVEKLILDEDWRKAVGIEGGPFCYVPNKLDIPF